MSRWTRKTAWFLSRLIAYAACVFALSVAAAALGPRLPLAQATVSYEFHDDADGQLRSGWGEGITLDYRSFSLGVASTRIVASRYRGLVFPYPDESPPMFARALAPVVPDSLLPTLPTLPPRAASPSGDVAGIFDVVDFGGWPFAAVTANATWQRRILTDSQGNLAETQEITSVLGGMQIGPVPASHRNVTLVPLRPIATGLLLDALLAFVVVEVAILAGRWTLARVRSIRGRCPTCGYILAETRSQCSECGSRGKSVNA